jgi:hypothetical protein
MNEMSKPTVLHVGALFELCAERYRAHFRIFEIAPGAPPEPHLADLVIANLRAHYRAERLPTPVT